MEFGEKEFKKLLILFLMLSLVALVFLIIKPIFIPIVTGLVLAYLFTPLYRITLRYVKKRTLSAAIVSFIALLIIIVPLWFVLPLIIEQIFEIFRFTQTLNVQSFIQTLFPTAAESFLTQMTVTLNSVISKLSSLAVNQLTDFLLDLPRLGVGLFILAFVFFFSLRDGDKLGEFVSGVSPINKSKEKIIIQQFKGVTDTILYGQVIVGIIQGLLAGLGLFLFGIPNALTLTIIAIFLCIIPFTGAFFVWIPVSVYLFTTEPFGIAFGFFLYNLLIVSTIDNILRSYIVSRKTDLSPAIIIIGMIGGIVVFGVLGIILGPLILAYLITFLRSYKEKTLYTLFLE